MSSQLNDDKSVLGKSEIQPGVTKALNLVEASAHFVKAQRNSRCTYSRRFRSHDRVSLSTDKFNVNVFNHQFGENCDVCRSR